MRLFVAVNIPDALRESISELVDRLRIDNDFVRWVDPVNIHLTLKFLGEVSSSLLGEVGETVAATVSRYPTFELTVEGVGAFPNSRKPRVVWLGVRDGEILEAVQSDLDRELKPLGFEKESRPFRPHLTIGRVKGGRGWGGRGPTSVEDRLDKVAMGPARFRVTSIELMESILRPTGAVYRLRISAHLRREGT